MMKFDNDILFEFLPEEDKKNFLVWDSAFINISSERIVATYRAPFEEKIFISLSDYDARVKQKEREIKLNAII